MGNIPNSLMDLLNAQIHQLHKSRETAQIASIIGRDFEYDLMAQISFLKKGIKRRSSRANKSAYY